MNRNRRIFITVFIGFLLVVILIVADMARRTTAPWNKRKTPTPDAAQTPTAIPDRTAVDTTADTLLQP